MKFWIPCHIWGEFMIVNFVYNDRLQSVILPSKVNGQYNFLNDSKRTVFRIEGIDGKWIIKTTSMFEIREQNGDSLEVEPKKLYSFKNKTNNTDRIYLFTEEYTSDRMKFFLVCIPDVISISIGKDAKSITYDNDYVSSSHAILQYSNGNWSISDSSKNGTFVNGVKIQSGNLKYGDMIFIMGMKIILGKGCFSINNPDKKVKFLSSDFKGYVVPEMEDVVEDDDDLESVFFDRSPRFKRDIEPAEIQIDSPPRDNTGEEMPIMLTVGPALTMAMASMTTGTFAVTNAISSGNITSAIPTVVMSGSMCLGTLLWPTLTRRYTKKQKVIKENLRRAKYNEYLEMRRIDIRSICDEQSQILHENNISISECESRIMQIQRNLWERSIGQNDFLSFRIGIGNLPMFGRIQYNQRRFSLSEDVLEDKMFELCEEPKILKNVPISISLLDESVGIIGDKMSIHEFAKGLIIQLSALYSYDEVKLVVLYDSDDEQNFGFVKWLPHVWNKEKNLRLVASTAEEVKSVSAHLENVTSYRNSMNDTDLADESPYYVIFALSKSQFNRAEVLKTVLGSKKKIHISVVSVFPELRMLPKECAKVVELAGTEGRLFDKNDTAGNVTLFRPDISLNRSALELSTQLANIQLDDSDQSSKLPKMITFLQMMNVGKVEHLNVSMRWKENDPTKSLAVPVGVNPFGDLFVLDLHEKFHGPHGLVAGMTGSGKSEFIITYILSLAINYHPEEVSFILIDYKGGGMAKSFENLPHTAGIITNLDGSAIKRSLVSINSELKRRQALLAEASKIVGESNINIYQYQKLYREGSVTEPLSHLFIIADEFAELKTQQSDFMTELISAARIGRSLGVHLILATQKPSGVVDDQIWSNSRFRACLKVQERQDSMDMLKRPDAAELAETGRFYLQVGYNELFELGQSAWAGAEYTPSDRVIIEKDNGVEAIDLNGHIIRAIKPKNMKQSSGRSKKQLDAVTEYLQRTAMDEKVMARPLWLDPIPDMITVSQMIEKYVRKYESCRQKHVLNPIVGEYDDPANQKQGLLTLPITAEGNTIIYGAAGSGKTILLNTLLYSLITEHTPDELNLYLLDFADETLIAFAKAPHVGEVMLSNDSERITRLFKSLYFKIKKRKKKLSLLGMDYISYMQKNPDATDMPATIIVIHNYTAFAELYGDNEDDIVYLSREGTKYGIYFILSSLTTNGVRFRITQNFKQHLVLQLNDDGDYSTILGKTDGLFPAKIKGRGLVKADKLLEFQTAHLSDTESTFDVVKAKCAELSRSWKGNAAEKIPILPSTVDAEFLLPYTNDNEPYNLPIGVNKNTLMVQKYNFENHFANLVLSSGDDRIKFLTELLNLVVRIPTLKITVFDPEENLFFDESLFPADRFKHLNNIELCNATASWCYDEMVNRHKMCKAALEANAETPNLEHHLFIIVSMKSLITGLEDDSYKRLETVLENGNPMYRFNFIISDESKNVSSYSFNTWYKKHILGNSGIWCGNGVSEQYSIKATTTTSAMRQAIESSLGYVFIDGEAMLCKMMSEGDENANGT